MVWGSRVLQTIQKTRQGEMRKFSCLFLKVAVPLLFLCPSATFAEASKKASKNNDILGQAEKATQGFSTNEHSNKNGSSLISHTQKFVNNGQITISSLQKQTTQKVFTRPRR